MIDKDWYDIIAIRFDNMIMFGQKALQELRAKEDYCQLISRSEFKMMSRFDLGKKWGDYAEHAPTLFRLPEDTEFSVRLTRPYSHRRSEWI